jgi:pteridine reductase
VLVHYHHSVAAAAALVEELNARTADSAAALPADLADPQALTALVTAAAARWGRLDGLINNAAVFRPTPLAAATLDDWSNMMDVNLRAPFLLSQAAAPWLAERGGAIVNVTDVYADRPKANHAIYCATKAGLVSLTRSLARDLGPGIRVNAVAPGAILWPEQGDSAEQNRLLARTPLGRPGDPSDIATAVMYCLQAPYVTGQILAVDGGRSVVD